MYNIYILKKKERNSENYVENYIKKSEWTNQIKNICR